ncbi:SDR family oxidoreductase [Glutamicibacter sp. JC586]|uniref:SDR family oxidoreductase n=1 Tax=Glutamicibacter sp. JC586 TaxID=2590552 RepID=UPI001358ABE5|nr:SDR family oxidoreductase [Glutamicibacter sp. JC586]
MASKERIAVTGSTGALGSLVAQNLADLGVPQRLLVRDTSRAPQLPASTTHTFDYADRSASIRALKDIDVLFMVSAPESQHRLELHKSFIDTAVQAGVKHVVYTSFAAAAPDAEFTLAREHYETEEYLRASPLRFTFLRDNFYLDFLPDLLGADGVIRGPAGNGHFAPVARADVARTAATVLAEAHAHESSAYELSGPQSLSMSDVSRILREVRGDKASFHDESIDEAYASRAKYGAPQWQLDAWVSTYTAISGSVMAKVSDHVEIITGRAPMSFEDYLRS